MDKQVKNEKKQHTRRMSNMFGSLLQDNARGREIRNGELTREGIVEKSKSEVKIVPSACTGEEGS
jgi:hypothetical protein